MNYAKRTVIGPDKGRRGWRDWWALALACVAVGAACLCLAPMMDADPEPADVELSNGAAVSDRLAGWDADAHLAELRAQAEEAEARLAASRERGARLAAEAVARAAAREAAAEAAESPVLASEEPEPYVWADYGESGSDGGYSAAYAVPWEGMDGDASWFRRMGVVTDGERDFTWYSERTLPGGGLTALNESGRWTDSDGYVRDGDGYLSIAAPDGTPIGTEVETPFGMARVYDYNEGGSWDLYTGW